MPTLEVQLLKVEKNLAALEEVMKIGRPWIRNTGTSVIPETTTD